MVLSLLKNFDRGNVGIAGPISIAGQDSTAIYKTEKNNAVS
jgi:hypothetical protein